MDILIKFGKNVRAAREKKNMSQEELSYKSGVSVYYISRIERGKANVSLETLYKIVKTLNLQIPDWLK